MITPPTIKPHKLGVMDIYRPSYGDCSNAGISSRFDEVLIWSFWDEDAPPNAVVIVEDNVCGIPRTRAKAAYREKDWDMFGGCAIFTSNGVVPHHGEFIKLFDRFEGNSHPPAEVKEL